MADEPQITYDQFQPPYTVKVIIHVIKELGMPMIVMAGLIAILAGWIPSPLLDQHTTMLQNQLDINRIVADNNNKILRSAQQVDELIWVSRASCINQATNQHDKERCLRKRASD